jgi:hypothetical protein
MYHARNPDKQRPRTVTISEPDLMAVSNLLIQASRLVTAITSGSDEARAGTEESVGEPGGVDARAAVEVALKIRAARQRRHAHLSPAIFGEPGWDMLLSLFISEFEGPRLSVGRLTALAGAPPTTASRWLDYLEKERLISRESNPTDARSAFIALTDKGRTIMERYLCETIETAT